MNKPTKAVKAIITNENNEILLLQRNPKISNIDNWDLPGGLIEKDENGESALIREVKEELKLNIKILKRAKTWKFFRSFDKQWVSVQNYNCRILDGVISLSDEHINFKWVRKSDIRKFPVKDESLYKALN